MTPQVQTLDASRQFPLRAFVLTCLVVGIWVNASEIFRYFIIVMPMTRATFAMVPNVAPMSVPVFLAWGFWDSILVIMAVAIYWLCAERFGATLRIAVFSGSIGWLFFFALFWFAMLNMNLTTALIAAIALPLAWIELVIACLIARRCFGAFGRV